MTLREIVARIKAASPKTLVDKVSEMLAGLKCEHSVYPATTSERWKKLLADLNLESVNAVGVTLYGVNATAIDQIQQVLKKKYPVVGSVEYDQWRTVFVCGKDANDSDPIIICSNWYPASREEVKAMTQNASDTADTNTADDDPESEATEIDLDYFA